MTTALMIQGCGSDVGKSTIVAGLCRALARRGLTVRPFKPQNMSNNAAAALGGEIGRAQALQARAAGVAPDVRMNPVLLKPESEGGSQLIVMGQVRGRMTARDYQAGKGALLAEALTAYRSLAAEADIMLIEGAGSPAEINLRAGDIANMGFARAAGVPVILVGDIDRGGVIASIVGVSTVLDQGDRAMLRGFVINRFRGDPTLFDGGRKAICARTGLIDFGLVPHTPLAGRLPAEDSASLRERSQGGSVVIAALRTPRIANFDDLDPLAQDPGVDLRLIERGTPIPGDAAAVLVCGSKASRADLAALRDEGWDIDLAAHRRRGGWIMGVCGGYQMLGRHIDDPDGSEGAPGATDGLGYLDVTTVLGGAKTVRSAQGQGVLFDAALQGYEIHTGVTTGPDADRPLLRFADGRAEGATSSDGRVFGTYLHGVFANDGFRAAVISALGGRSGLSDFDAGVDAALDALADHIEAHVDVDGLLALAAPVVTAA